MEEYVFEAKKGNITPLFVGREACEPSHSFGPYIRDCYLVHFCLAGKGVLKNKDGIFGIGAGEFFVIRPGEITTYTADKVNPWEYIWIAFRSDEVYFDGKCSVFDTPHGLDDKLIGILEDFQLSYEGCLSVIYDLIYRASRHGERDACDEKIRRIRRYIKYNYMLPISVSNIAESFGFDRTYLYRHKGIHNLGAYGKGEGVPQKRIHRQGKRAYGRLRGRIQLLKGFQSSIRC